MASIMIANIWQVEIWSANTSDATWPTYVPTTNYTVSTPELPREQPGEPETEEPVEPPERPAYCEPTPLKPELDVSAAWVSEPRQRGPPVTLSAGGGDF